METVVRNYAQKSKIMSVAKRHLDAYRAQFAAHEVEKREAWARGEMLHYCVHGTNLWTDYDPMCGPCEDGYGYWDYLTFAGLALAEAKADYVRFEERLSLYVKLSNMGAPADALFSLTEWVSEPVEV